MKIKLFLLAFMLYRLAYALPGEPVIGRVVYTDTPVVFLPSPVMQQYSVRDMAISPDGKEMFFTACSQESFLMCILYCKKEKGKWSEPAMASFSGQYSDLEPAFTPDGKKLFFVSNRPGDKRGPVKDFDIWFVENKDGRWSYPVNAGTVINSSANEFYPSVSSNGNIYFTASYPDSKGKEDIYISEIKNGIYQKPYSLPAAVNSSVYEFNAWVSPDENLIIFSSQGRDDELGGGDLYVSKKNKEGSWQKAYHLPPPFNSTKLDYCPFISPDKKDFYFTSTRSVIKDHYDVPLTLPEFQALLRQPINGKGNIYIVNAKQIMESDQ